MVCSRCGRIIEFDAAQIVRLRTAIAEKHRFHDASHRFQIIGLCETCMKACPAAAGSGRAARDSVSRAPRK
jgi:Fur family ferric uptake transcriptional regulator